MLNRVVSFASLLVVIASIMLFLNGAWSIFTGRMGEGDGIFTMAGFLVAAMFFAYRFADPAYIDAVSIVKSR